MKIHQYSIAELLALLDSTERGLSVLQAARRLETDGPNDLQEKAGVSPMRIMAAQFADFMILVLAVAAGISFALGDSTDALVILGIILLNATVGFIQEYKAEQAMAALKQMSAPSARVVRDGHVVEIPARELVRGDIVVLESGNVVPADARIVNLHSLRVDEAALTGESQAVDKSFDQLHADFLPIGDRSNMVFKGTHVTHGNARVLVVATGMETELGKIAAMLQENSIMQTPLQRRLVVFGRKLAYLVVGISAAVSVLGLIRGEDPLTMVLTGISLAVAAIPEALPAVVTVALALSAKRMTGYHALIRKLPAVETLGSITYICTDKTGTLTQQRMSVREIAFAKSEVFSDQDIQEVSTHENSSMLMRMMSVSNDVERTERGEFLGESTELAFVRFAEQSGNSVEHLHGTFPKVATLPFDSSRKRMSTIHRVRCENNDEHHMYTKGAADVLIPLCSFIMIDGSEQDFDDQTRVDLQRESTAMAARGLRVLAFAYRRLNSQLGVQTTIREERDLVLVGLVGLMDPPRPEARRAVQQCHEASIIPVMITGDHPETARAIAKELGILRFEHEELVTSGELDAMSDTDFAKRIANIRVYARVAPEQKLRIVKALQQKGEYVAMTGDGVNDAPALKCADIGIAMGINGTDVSKEASSMILLDDNFSTIVKAVSEGRRVFDNIRKFIRYIMTSNSGEIWCIMVAPLVGLPIPLLPVHILWINLVTDGLPALALATEPAEESIMNRPPRPPGESLFAGGLGRHIIWVGVLMGTVPLLVQFIAIHVGDVHWQTMVFSVLCISQLGHALAVRSERVSIYHQGIFTNRALTAAVGLALVLQALIVFEPSLQEVFHTKALTTMEIIYVILASAVVFVAVEIEKKVLRTKH